MEGAPKQPDHSEQEEEAVAQDVRAQNSFSKRVVTRFSALSSFSARCSEKDLHDLLLYPHGDEQEWDE
jgi:hypothetical protein